MVPAPCRSTFARGALKAEDKATLVAEDFCFYCSVVYGSKWRPGSTFKLFNRAVVAPCFVTSVGLELSFGWREVGFTC